MTLLKDTKPMFWIFLLAHLIADYPLQTEAMIAAKNRLSGLIVHVLVHLAMMLGFIYIALDVISWLWIIAALIIAGCHLGIDALKNYATKHWPKRFIRLYFADQILHIVSIIIVIEWLTVNTNATIFVTDQTWLFVVTGYVFVTHVTHITEQTMTHCDPDYQHWAKNHIWLRMVSRVILFSLYVMDWNQWSILLLISGLVFYYVNLLSQYWWRSLFIDMSIVGIAALTFYVALDRLYFQY